MKAIGETLGAKWASFIQLVKNENRRISNIMRSRSNPIQRIKPEVYFKVFHPLLFYFWYYLLLFVGVVCILISNIILYVRTKVQLLFPEIKPILGTLGLQLSIGIAFIALYSCWLIVLLLQNAGGSILLIGLALTVTGLFSLRVAGSIYRGFRLKPLAVITSIGSIPLYIFGFPLGFALALVIGLIAIAHSVFRLAKNVWKATKEASYLILTPLMIYLLVSNVTGITGIDAERRFTEATTLISRSIPILFEIGDDYRKSLSLFHYDYMASNFSPTPMKPDEILNLEARLKPSLLTIANNSQTALDLIEGMSGLATDYLKSSAEGLLAATIMVQIWLNASKFVSKSFYEKDLSPSQLSGEVQLYADLLSECTYRLNRTLTNPVMSLLGSMKEDILRGAYYTVKVLEWSVAYYPSTYLSTNSTFKYDRENDILTIELQLVNNGTEPLIPAPTEIAVFTDWLTWDNYEYFDEHYRLSYKPNEIKLDASSKLEPYHSLRLTMRFIDIDSTLRKYRYDLRTFIQQIIVVKFPSTYIQFNAHEAFRATLVKNA